MTSPIETLTDQFPSESWTTDTDIMAPHLVEWRDKYHGKTPVMLRPGSTGECAQMVKACAELGLKIVPQGGNTGLVGGQTPQGEVLLSTKRLNKIRSANPTTNALIVEAGVTLLEVQEAAKSINRKFPLSLASEGTCTIGGNLSTNAGGVHVLKYGTTKELVFGVEAVLPNGEIYNGLTDLRKDNTGYDLSKLFLGAEGTLGIITAASLKLFPQPAHIQRAMIGTDSIEKALALLDHCRVADHLAMFEVIPRIGLDLVTTHIPRQTNPFDETHNWYVLMDWEVSSVAQGEDIAETKLGSALEQDIIQDAVIAQSDTQAAKLLSLREHMSAAQKHNGGSIKHDITVPIDKIPEFFTRADKAVQNVIPGARPVGFGHLGDGNIHYNIAQPVGADKAKFLSYWQALSEPVFDIVDALGGSISAEHGIGIMKRADLAERADPIKLEMMRTLKRALDPHNMMNPRVLI